MSEKKVIMGKRLFYGSVAAFILAQAGSYYNISRFEKTKPKPTQVVGEMISTENRIDTAKKEIAYDKKNPDEVLGHLRYQYTNKDNKWSSSYNPKMTEPTIDTVNMQIAQKEDLQKDLEAKLRTYNSNQEYVVAYKNYQKELEPYNKEYDSKFYTGLDIIIAGSLLVMTAATLHTNAQIGDLKDKGYNIIAVGRGAIVAKKREEQAQ